MAVSRVSFGAVAMVTALIFAIALLPAVIQAQSPAPAPTSDGTSIDQRVACVLMLVAFALTYLIHAADFSYAFKKEISKGRKI